MDSAVSSEPEVTEEAVKPDSRSPLSFWLKVSRPGLWSTAVWFYMLPVGREPVFRSWQFWLGLFYVAFPLGFLLYGWNDIGDRETDRLNPRKDNYLFGARGTEAQLAGLPRWIVLFQTPFILLFVILEGARALGWFAALLAANALYNWRRIGFKSRPPFDMLNQAGYLLVFVLSSRLNRVPQLPWPTFVFGALFAMHSHLFAEILDFEPDRLSGRRTTAVALGVRASKLLLVPFLLCEAAIVAGILGNWWIGGFLALSALWFLLDAGLFQSDKLDSQSQIRLFALGLNVLAVASIPYVWMSGTFNHWQ